MTLTDPARSFPINPMELNIQDFDFGGLQTIELRQPTAEKNPPYFRTPLIPVDMLPLRPIYTGIIEVYQPTSAPSSQVGISASFDAGAPLYVQAFDEATGAWVDVANNRGAPSVGLMDGDPTTLNLRVFRADTNEYFYRNTESSRTTVNADGSITVAFEDWNDGDFNDAVVTLRGRNEVVAPPPSNITTSFSVSFESGAALRVQVFDIMTNAWVTVADNRSEVPPIKLNGDPSTMNVRIFKYEKNVYYYKDMANARTTVNADGSVTVAFEDWHDYDQEYIPEIAAELMQYYGTNGGIDLAAVTAMMQEGVLSQQKNAAGDGGFAFSLGAIPTERAVGHHDYDVTSLGTLFETLGIGSPSATQMQTLISIYGDGTTVNGDTIFGAMKEDGFLTFADDLWGGATADWNKIDGARIVVALFAQIGTSFDGQQPHLGDEDFISAFGLLFGYTEVQPLAYLAARFGENYSMTDAQMAALFNDGHIDLHVDETTGHIAVDVLTGRSASSGTGSGISDSLLMRTVIHLAEYYANGDGVFSAMENGLHGRIFLDGAGINQSTFAHLNVLYGSPAGGTFTIEDLNQMLADWVLVPRDPRTSDFFLDLDLTKVPSERYVSAMFAHAGKNPATDALTAQDFESSFETVFGVPDWLESAKTADGTSYPSEAAYLAKVNGTLGDDGEYRMNHADIVDIFKSQDIILNSETRYIVGCHLKLTR